MKVPMLQTSFFSLSSSLPIIDSSNYRAHGQALSPLHVSAPVLYTAVVAISRTVHCHWEPTWKVADNTCSHSSPLPNGLLCCYRYISSNLRCDGTVCQRSSEEVSTRGKGRRYLPDPKYTKTMFGPRDSGMVFGKSMRAGSLG